MRNKSSGTPLNHCSNNCNNCNIRSKNPKGRKIHMQFLVYHMLLATFSTLHHQQTMLQLQPLHMLHTVKLFGTGLHHV